jgi:nucleoside-diphosphate-sugar epimerase
MRAFVTGGTGFIGGTVVRELRERGDEVVALVRSPEKAGPLLQLGCELVRGDLADGDAIAKGVAGVDAVFHIGAIYKVGVPVRDRQAMWDANVVGTERVLDAAIAAGVARIVDVSTINAFGNTHGRIVDETYQRPLEEGFLSIYDETKYRAHEAALARMRAGEPVLVAQPGGVYGPGDNSELGNLLEQVRTGRLKFLFFPETGFNLAHVDDIAHGIVLVHDAGRLGESYVLGGEITRMGDALRTAAVAAGRKPPRWTMPSPLIRASIPLAPLVTKAMRMPPNLRELVRTADGVTYWATDAKARSELGYAPRDLATGLRQTLEAAG